ncbi:MAG: hypothetical protein GWN00_21045 [Aliifodinibius sp.]|nr:hypothetical protein [Fodinibius sp.]NIW46373.1 hypothetical protein [Gammaproteobacteria bacterium]NIY27201.1 hypothetical protein [Fodinibius sp.]
MDEKHKIVKASQITAKVVDDYKTFRKEEWVNPNGFRIESGDTIPVHPGTYDENINFIGKNLLVSSEYLTTDDTSYISSTIIDGNGSGRVVTFSSGEDNSAIITGFTFQNGYATGFGGGVYCSNSNPVITHNIIINNHTNASGGGIYCLNSNNPIITYNTIADNSADHEGGGMYMWDATPTISYNVLYDNISQGGGGGITCDNSSPTIISNTIYGNEANGTGVSTYYGGGGICCWTGSSPTITNNIVWGNTAAVEHGQLYIDSGSSTVTYCDIQDTLWPGEGNKSCDPRFCDTTINNYYLEDCSCCNSSGQGGENIGALGVECICTACRT